MAAQVDHRHLRPEDRDRRRPDPSGVIEKDAQRRVELVINLGQPIDLCAADVGLQPRVITFAAREALHFVDRHCHLVIALGQAHPVEPLGRRIDRRIGPPVRQRRVFPAQQRVGLQHVGQGRGHMADLVALGLAVPGEDLVVEASGTPCLGDRERRIQQRPRLFRPVGQPQQPIGRHVQRLRAGRHHMPPRHPRIVRRQHLRDARPVHPDGARERRPAQARDRQRRGQTVAKRGGNAAFVGFIQHR